MLALASRSRRCTSRPTASRRPPRSSSGPRRCGCSTARARCEVVRGRVRRERRGRGARAGARGRQARSERRSRTCAPTSRTATARVPDNEEDRHAEEAARALQTARTEGTAPASFGLRVKSFADGAEARSLPDARHVPDDADRGRRRVARRVRRHVPEGHDARARRAVRRGARTPGGGARAGRAHAALRGAGRDAAVGDRRRTAWSRPPHPRRGRWADHGRCTSGCSTTPRRSG